MKPTLGSAPVHQSLHPDPPMIYAAHSGLRFLLFLAGLLVVVWGVYGMVGKRPYDKVMARLATVFTGLLDLQILVGVAVLFSRPFGTQVIGHFIMMLLAAAAAHGTGSVVRKRPQEEKTFAPHVVGAILALAFVATGILALGRGVFASTI